MKAPLKRKRKINSIQGERKPATVQCTQQNVDYYPETFHLIEKGDDAEAKYHLTEQSRTHGWTPKLSLRLFNMKLNDLYRIYLVLMEKHNPGRRPVSRDQGSNTCFLASKGKQDENKGSRPSITSQGYEKCI